MGCARQIGAGNIGVLDNLTKGKVSRVSGCLKGVKVAVGG